MVVSFDWKTSGTFERKTSGTFEKKTVRTIENRVVSTKIVKFIYLVFHEFFMLQWMSSCLAVSLWV